MISIYRDLSDVLIEIANHCIDLYVCIQNDKNAKVSRTELYIAYIVALILTSYFILF